MLRATALFLLVGCACPEIAGALLNDEPCAITEQAGADTDCAPTCVTCACCTQARETVDVVLIARLRPEHSQVAESRVTVPNAYPRKIPHVPKSA